MGQWNARYAPCVLRAFLNFMGINVLSMEISILFTCVFYAMVLVFFVAFILRTVSMMGKGRLKADRRLSVHLLAGTAVTAITACSLFSFEFPHGNYLVYAAFALSPVFIQCHSSSEIRFVKTVGGVVTALCAVLSACLCLGILPGWAGAAVLIALVAETALIASRTVWRRSDTSRRSCGGPNSLFLLEDMVDLMYGSFLVTIACFGYAVGNNAPPPWADAAVTALGTVLLLGLLSALRKRREEGRMFLLTRGREAAFVKKYRLYAGTVGRGMRIEAGGENLFAKLQRLFEEKKPYLNADLTMDWVAKVLLTNKMYLSRAVNESTGRSFTQYVNYYRVRHAVRLMKEDESLKLPQVMRMCGFNTMHTFAMAFNLYMNISPSQWCRVNRGVDYVERDVPQTVSPGAGQEISGTRGEGHSVV